MKESFEQPLQIVRQTNPASTINQSVQKPINPLKIIEKQQLSTLGKGEQIEDSSTGKFVNEILLASNSIKKGKPIIKPAKVKNYRTRMCEYGMDCRRRLTCPYAHNDHQLRKPFIKRTKPCIRYQRGLCHLGSACREYHGNIDLHKNYKYKQQLCQAWLKEGKCEKGVACIYLHENPNQTEQIKIQQQRQVESDEKVKIVNKIQQSGPEKQDSKQQKLNIPHQQKSTVKTALKKEQIVQILPQKASIIEDGFSFSFPM